MPIVNLEEMAGVLGVSRPTMRDYVAKYADLPFVERGGQGIAWKFDTEAVIAFLAERKAEEQADEERRTAAVAQLSLPQELLKPEATPGQGGDFQLRDIQTMRAADQLGKERGFLVETVRMRRALSQIWAPLNQALSAIPGDIGKRYNLPSAAVRDMKQFIHAQQRELHRQFTKLLGEGPAPPDDLDDAA